jgi:6-phosphogluconolactonase
MKKLLSILPILVCIMTNSVYSQKTVPFYIGTGDKSDNSSITLAELDLTTGAVALADSFISPNGPGFVAISPNKKNLYAVTGANVISAYSIGPGKKLTLLNSQPSYGANPCHVSVHPSGKLVFLANYTGGSFSAYPVEPDGKLGPASYTEQYSGTGPNTRRQEKAHAHYATPTPDGKFVFVADLGSDKIMNYKVDQKSAKLIPNPAQPFYTGHPGAGPRHLVVHPSGKSVFLLNELDATLTALSLSKDGVLTALQTYPTVPDGLTGNTSSAIHLHPNGQFVYVSNRGHNSISAFKILRGGMLEKIDEITKSISIPRDFNIDPSGKFMVIGNQDKHNLTIYDVNPQTGKLAFRSESVAVKAPICIVFF